MTDPIKQIRDALARAADEIGAAGHNGWGNACRDGAAAITELLARLDAQQAKIDALMLEYCPSEMTPEQIKEWGDQQRPGMSMFANKANYLEAIASKKDAAS